MDFRVCTCEARHKRRRTIAVVVGAEYVFKALNPKAKKHRGRKVLVLAYDEAAREMTVRWLDTNATGKVSAFDLVPVEPAFLWEDVPLKAASEKGEDPPPVDRPPAGFFEALRRVPPVPPVEPPPTDEPTDPPPVEDAPSEDQPADEAPPSPS